MTKKRTNSTWNIILIIAAVFALISVGFLIRGVIGQKEAEVAATEPPVPTEAPSYTMMESFESHVDQGISEAQDAALNTKKVFWIPEDAEIAPKPNESCYGQTDDPTSLQWLLDKAADLLDGQELVFSTNVEICPNTVINYYLDDSIFVITWQEVYKKYVYTFSEVKINHPSQFRRYLAGNEYDSDYFKEHIISEYNWVLPNNYTNEDIAELYDELNATIRLLEDYQGETNDNYQLAFGANEFNNRTTRYSIVAYDYGYSTDVERHEQVGNVERHIHYGDYAQSDLFDIELEWIENDIEYNSEYNEEDE